MKMLRKVLLTLFGIACFLAAAFVLLMAYVSFTSPDIGAGFGTFMLVITACLSLIGFFVLKRTVASKQVPTAAPALSNNAPAAVSDPIEKEPETVEKTVEEKPETVEEAVEEAVEEGPASANPVVSVPDDSKKTTFLVAGIYYREDAVIDNLLYENPDFEMTKEEIIECCMEDTDIYKYEPFYGYADLVPEPDNPHDPNAIKVIVDGIHIGYVPAKRTKSIKKILDSNNVIAIGCEIFGGPFKILPDELSDIERGKTDIKSRICIDYK